jgi:glucoamylase
MGQVSIICLFLVSTDNNRPQNDGPALRAATFMEAAEAIFQRNPNASEIVTNIYWPIILNDLNYVGQYWNTTSYDLWEEVNGNSYFTTTAQHRALVQGQILAERLNQTCEPCQQAPEILCFLSNNFWNESAGHLIANINANQVTRSEVGVDPLLGAMHAFDINATCDAASLQPCNSRVLATHKVVVDVFRNLYEINHNATAPAAVAVGRYPEDTYYGGNPWYITTLACAEVLYDAVAQLRKNDTLTIDETSLGFFTDLYENATIGEYSGDEKVLLLDAMTTYADGFVEVVQKYTPENGTLNEQINKTTGEPLSAIALTWSFASFITASERRAGQYPPSWGANTTFANNGSSTCSFSSYNATYSYSAATAAGAPNVSEPLCMKEVLFIANYSTEFGTNIYIVGNNSLFGGSLDIELPIQVLRTGNITADDPIWNVPAWVVSPQTIEYQYVLQNQTAGTYLRENQTRTVEVGACDGQIQRLVDVPTFPEE